jgi:Ca-activated chloride channel family protein
MTLNLQTDRLLVRAAARSTRYLHVSFRAPAAPARADRRPLTVAFVLDRSGSMAGDKIRLAKQAIDTAVRMLKPDDLFSIVVYDDRIDVLAPAARATPDARRAAADRLGGVDARGSTNLSTGWLRGCEQVAERASRDTIGRCLLLSDGLANQGITSREELADRAGQLRTAYVVTSTFGVGRDFDEPLMEAMAHAGGGNFYFIERAEQIEDLLTSELGEALEVVARRALVHLDLPPGAEAEVMHRFRSTQDGRRLRVELDDLVSEQDVSFIVRLRFGEGTVGERTGVHVRLSSEDEAVEAAAELSWEYADHDANDRQPRHRAVDRLVAEIYAARARRDAVEHNRTGHFAAARHGVEATARRIRSYAGDDRELHRIADALEAEQDRVAESMDPMALKQMHFDSSSIMKMRDPSGRARRHKTP